MKTLFGKEVRTYSESSWKLVPGSAQQFTKSSIKRVTEIEVKYSEEYEHLYAVVKLKEGYVSWQLDRKFRGEEGDLIDPASFMVFQLTNGEKTITRCTGRTRLNPCCCG